MKLRACIGLMVTSLLLLIGCAERQDANLSGTGVLTFLAQVPALGRAVDVAAYGNTAYLIDSPFGITVWDLTNPAAPVLTDTIVIADLYDPQAIVIDSTGRLLGIYDKGQVSWSLHFYDLALNQELLLQIGSSGSTKFRLRLANNLNDTLTLWRSDNTDGLSFEKYYDQNPGAGLAFDALPGHSTGSTYQNSTYGFALGAADHYYVTLSEVGIVALDWSGFAPQLIGQLNVPGLTRDAALLETILCLASGYEGLQTVDVSNPASPVLMGALRITNATNIERVESYGSLALLLDINDGVFAVDVSDPFHPTLAGELLLSNPNGYCLSSNLVLIADDDMGLVVGELPAIP